MKPILPLLAASVIAAGIAPARADLRYTTTMQMGGEAADADAKPQMATTTFVKGMRERTETVMDMGMMHQKTVAITQCDLHQSLRLDPELKIYTVSPVGAVGLAAMGKPAQGHHKEGKGGQGKVVTTISVQDLGVETVNKLKSHHYILTMHLVESGCLGDHDDTMKFEEWIAPVQGGRMVCPEMTTPTRTVDNGNGCHVTYEIHGDLTALKSIYGGLPVRMKFYNGDKVVMQQDIKDYSGAALDAGLFDAPADYKKVSEEEFSKAQMQAMMKHLQMPQDKPEDAPSVDPGSVTPGVDVPQPEKPEKPKKPKIHFPF